eukprot:gene24413-27270_t
MVACFFLYFATWWRRVAVPVTLTADAAAPAAPSPPSPPPPSPASAREGADDRASPL